MSDVEIARAALVHIQKDPALAGAVVRVQSTNGIVEITGTTKNLLAKRRAARHAEVIRGVRSVSNRLTVEHADVADDVLARGVRSALADHLPGSADRILVEARNGVVTLGGSSPSIGAKHLAVSIAEGVRGTTDVLDFIDVVAAKRSDAEIAGEARVRS